MKFQKGYGNFQHILPFVMNRTLLMQPKRAFRPAACAAVTPDWRRHSRAPTRHPPPSRGCRAHGTGMSSMTKALLIRDGQPIVKGLPGLEPASLKVKPWVIDCVERQVTQNSGLIVDAKEPPPWFHA